MEIRSCVAGEEITVTNTKNEVINFTLYTLDESAVAEAVTTLSAQTMEMESYTDTEIMGHITITDPGRLIFSIPYDSGWTLYVDGEETGITPFRDAFIGVYLQEGEHEICLKYKTPGLGIGALISGGSIFLFIAAVLIRRFINRKKEICNEQTDYQYYRSML